jgi:glycosyltransferase involved in cell wall biosynthesis
VVDDGSTDDGPARVEALAQPKVRLIRQQNGGVSSARNRGIHEARGEYVAFLDADDVYLPGFAQEIATLIRTFPEAGCYATAYLRTWPDGKSIPNFIPRSLRSGQRQIVQDPFEAWSRSNFFCMGSFCVRRDIFYERNIFFPLGENVGEDHDVIYRLFETGNVAVSSKPLLAYTQGVLDSLYSGKPDYLPPCYTRLLARASGSDYPKHLRVGAYRVVAVNQLVLARRLIALGRRVQAFDHLMGARLMAHPTFALRTFIRWCFPAAFFRPRWLHWI